MISVEFSWRDVQHFAPDWSEEKCEEWLEENEELILEYVENAGERIMEDGIQHDLEYEE
jgi:hypothetical protein